MCIFEIKQRYGMQTNGLLSQLCWESPANVLFAELELMYITSA